MSDKSKKFQPNPGYILAVHQNILYIRTLARELDIHAEIVAEAMEKAGVQLQADPFDLSADARKVILLQEQNQTAGLRVVEKENGDEPSGDTSTD